MPITWFPKRRTIEDAIAEEQAKIEALRVQRQAPIIEKKVPVPEEVEEPTPWQPTYEPTPQPSEAWMPPQAITPPTPMPIKVKPEIKKEPISVPFWQRALQVFTAPFEWVDDYIIKPGLALTGTMAGFVPEVARLPGEDFWEWKKRSWAGWEAPGININVPWSDKPARIDIKGIMESAPWLLIPGAGQVGVGARVARGIAGIVGQFGRVGQVIGTAIEYSPWGLVEKTAGVALKAGFRGIG